MKLKSSLRYLFSVMTVALTLEGTAVADQVRTVTLEEVVEKVSSENYTVYSNALRVYQARQAIEVARGSLLPKLNLWRLAMLPIDWGSAPEILVQDIAPFLVPANWFRVQEQKLLYLAETEGYRALWANELMTAKTLYIHLLLDQSLLEHVQESREQLEELLVIVQSREAFGGASPGASRDLEVRLLALQEDRRALESLIAEEENQLAYMLGEPAEVVLRPAKIAMPDFRKFVPLQYADFEFRAVDSSPEIRQFDHLITAVDFIKKEIVYSFLGTTSMSRGVAGGVFDNLPIQDGLGFGTPASMRIVQAKKELMKTQRKGIEETIRRHLRLLIKNYNLDLENYDNLERRASLTRQASDDLRERLALGQPVEVSELIESSRNHIQADTAFFAIQFRFMANAEKLSRLIFHGDYNKPPVVIERLRADKSKNGRLLK